MFLRRGAKKGSCWCVLPAYVEPSSVQKTQARCTLAFTSTQSHAYNHSTPVSVGVAPSLMPSALCGTLINAPSENLSTLVIGHCIALTLGRLRVATRRPFFFDESTTGSVNVAAALMGRSCRSSALALLADMCITRVRSGAGIRPIESIPPGRAGQRTGTVRCL